MCYYAPFRSKEMWDWHTTVTIKKQQTLEQVLYRVPDHCIRAVKTATSYTDRTKLLCTIAFMRNRPTVLPRGDPERPRLARRKRVMVFLLTRPGQLRSYRREHSRAVLIPAFIRGSCNVNKGVTNGTNGILDTSTAWDKIF